MNKRFLLLLITALLLVSAYNIMGAGMLPSPLTGVNSIGDLIKKISEFIKVLAIAITPILIIYAGILYIFSGGEPGKVTNAKNILIWTAVGLLIVLSSDALIGLIQSFTK